MDYISSVDLEAYIGSRLALFAQAQPGAVDAAITAACARVDAITGQDGGLGVQTGKTVTIVNQIEGAESLLLPNKPVAQLTDLTVRARDGIGVDVTLADAELHGREVLFPLKRLQRGWEVSVTYDCGYADPPAGAARAALILAASYIVGDNDNPAGNTIVTNGTVRFSYQRDLADAQARRLLRPHSVSW